MSDAGGRESAEGGVGAATSGLGSVPVTRGPGGVPLPPEPHLPHMQGGGWTSRMSCISPVASYSVIWARPTVFSEGQTLGRGQAPPGARGSHV